MYILLHLNICQTISLKVSTIFFKCNYFPFCADIRQSVFFPLTVIFFISIRLFCYIFETRNKIKFQSPFCFATRVMCIYYFDVRKSYINYFKRTRLCQTKVHHTLRYKLCLIIFQYFK